MLAFDFNPILAATLTFFAVLFTAPTNALFNSAPVSAFRIKDSQTLAITAIATAGNTFGSYWANVVAQQAGAKLGAPTVLTNIVSLWFYLSVVKAATAGSTTLIDDFIRQARRGELGEHRSLFRTDGSWPWRLARMAILYGLFVLVTSIMVVIVETQSALDYAKHPSPSDFTGGTIANLINKYPGFAYFGALFEGFFEVYYTLNNVNIAEDAFSDLWSHFSGNKLLKACASITLAVLSSAVLITLALLNETNPAIIAMVALNSFLLMFAAQIMIVNALSSCMTGDCATAKAIFDTEKITSFALPLTDHHRAAAGILLVSGPGPGPADA